MDSRLSIHMYRPAHTTRSVPCHVALCTVSSSLSDPPCSEKIHKKGRLCRSSLNKQTQKHEDVAQAEAEVLPLSAEARGSYFEEHI